MAEIDNKHEVNDSVDMSIKTDNEVSTSLIEVSDNEVSDNPIDGLTDSVTNSLTESLTDIDWQRSEDGSYSPSSYINRDLSLLQFHLRVLAQAASSRHPLLERLFFLIIFPSLSSSNNLYPIKTESPTTISNNKVIKNFFI